MGFWKELFKDNNDINEKSVVGFLSFSMMVIALFVDLITGWMGKELLINEPKKVDVSHMQWYQQCNLDKCFNL